MITAEERLAARDAVGWDVSEHDIKVALQKWTDSTLDGLRALLDEAVDVFDAAGGRGVVLADEIDMLRIAIAVRETREKRG